MKKLVLFFLLLPSIAWSQGTFTFSPTFTGTGLPTSSSNQNVPATNCPEGATYYRTDSPGGIYFCHNGAWIGSQTTVSPTQPPAGSTITNSCPANATGGGTQTAVSWVQVPNQTNTWAIDECYDTSNGSLTLLATTFNNQPMLTCSPLSLTFPATNTSQSSPTQSVTCTDTSTNGASVVFTSPSFTTGTNFSQNNTCSTIAPAASCTYNVTFTPTTTSSACPSGLTDTLSINSNASGSPATVTLCGQGQTPSTPTPSSVSVTPASPSIGVGGTSQESARLVYSDSSNFSIDLPFWNSATTANATVNGKGLVSGVAAGTSVITANSGSPLHSGPAENTGGSGPITSIVLPGISTVVGGSILVATDWGAATGSVSSITDTQGNSYTEAASGGCLEQANSSTTDWWIATGTPASTGATNVITVAFAGGGVAFPDITAVPIVGNTTVDQCTKGTVASGTSLASAALTPAQASEMIISTVSTGNFVKAVNSGSFCITAGNAGQSAIDGTGCPVSGAGGSVFWQDTFSTSAVTPTATLNAASNGAISSLALKTVSGNTTVTVNNTQASYTLQNEPPNTWYPYPVTGSLFNQAIPASPRCLGASANGISGANCTTADSAAKFLFNCINAGSEAKCGELSIGAANSSANMTPIYYATAADPWFSTTNHGLNVSFHCTNNAQFSGSVQDQELVCFDQAQNILVNAYGFNKGSGFSIGNSTCPGNGTSACALKIPNLGYTSAGRVGIDPDYDAAQAFSVTFPGNYILGTTVGSAGGNALGAMVRWPELVGTINHALFITVPCVNPSAGIGSLPFPGTGTLLPCSSSDSRQPVPGRMYMLDYTAAQISTLCGGSACPAWQAALLTAASKYGMYVDQTGGDSGFTAWTIGDEGIEGQKAFQFANVTNTNLATICGQGGFTNGTCVTDTTAGGPGLGHLLGYMFNNVSRVTGPEGTDLEGNSCTSGAGCFPSGHLHAIDQCTAKTMAGKSGGC